MPPSGRPNDDPFAAFAQNHDHDNEFDPFIYPFDADFDLNNADDPPSLIHTGDSHPKGPEETVLFQPVQSTTLHQNLSPTASDDQDSASDSSTSPKIMNNGDPDVDMAFDEYRNNAVDINYFLNDDPNTIDPAMMHQWFSPEGPSPTGDSSSPSDSNSSSSALNDSDESLPLDFKTSPNFIPPQKNPQTRNKRHSVGDNPRRHFAAIVNRVQQQSSTSVTGMSGMGSREVSPMSQSQMVLSQGSSPLPFASMDTGMPDQPRFATESRRVPPGNPPSWFNVKPQFPSGQMNGGAHDSLGSTHFPMMQANPLASPRPTLTLHGMPGKSRVETQIHLKMSVHRVPEGVKKIRLPANTISKPKFLAKPRPQPQPDTFDLSTQLVCTSAMAKPVLKAKALERAALNGLLSTGKLDAEEEKPENGGEVRICGGCMTREKKRANRKKNKKPDEDEDWRRHEADRVIVFNTQEVKELKPPLPDYSAPAETMEIDLPMRIACYCRHHHEKTGFQVIFTLKNHHGVVVAQTLSPSIMITDDHKGPQSNSNHIGGSDNADPVATPAASDGTNDMNTIQPGHFRQIQSTSDIQALKRSASALSATALHSGNSSIDSSTVPTPRNLSRPPSPGAAGPSAKKRKSSGPKIPTTLHMTPLGTGAFAPATFSNLQNGQPGPSSSSTSPFLPPNSIPLSDGSAPAFGHVASSTASGISPGPQTPNSNEQIMFQSDASRPNTEGRALQPLFSTPVSAQNSRAPSPNSMMGGAFQQQQPLNQLGHAPQMLTHGLPVTQAFPQQQQQQPPVILKVVPTEGPISGGIEISILGSGFRQGQELYFGETKATTTTYWADSAMTCLLPPYHQAGPVPVSVRGPNGQVLSLPRPLAQFLYKDENQLELSQLALTVLNHKLTGNLDGVKEFIQRVISGQDIVNGNGFNGGVPGAYTMNSESQLLQVLNLVDMDDSMNKAKFNLKRKSTGQTMLHLSVALGYHRFTAGLLARGANPNVRDVGGYTPLHYAAMHDHAELVRRLIQHRADPTIKTYQGLLASDVATTRDVIRAIKRAGRRGSTLHSRASSATSLRSIWEPPRRQTSASHEFSYSDASSESEETIGLSSEGELDADDSYLDMAIRSRRGHEAHSSRVSLVDLPQAEDQGGMTSAADAIASFKEGVQQLQQTMMQNLSHIQMPNMTALQQYQAYLNWNSAQQLMSAYMPNIGSSFTPSSMLPPAYEEIFPRGRQEGKSASTEYGSLDTKTESAARAAADYDADRKCAVLFDQTQETRETRLVESSTATEQQSEEKQVQRQLPKILQIGRKNNITKEQQDNLRQARAEKQKSLSSDHKLFMIWVSRSKPSTICITNLT